MTAKIPEAVLAFFASDPIGPSFSVARHAGDLSSPIHADLEAYLLGLTSAEVDDACHDPMFEFLRDSTLAIDRAARLWTAEKQLATGIPRRRLQALHDGVDRSRPGPYELPALADLEVDEDHLVALSEFDFDGSRLIRNGHAFLLLATTPACNSTYWLLRAIYQEGVQAQTRVRLDPFLHGPTRGFPAMSYRMLVYGRPLDWDRLRTLKAPEHGRWMPDSLSHGQFTDFVWSPWDQELHFVCEEVPACDEVESVGARYLHAVYTPSMHTIDHLDGALRLYSHEEIADRCNQHVRNAGKSGFRRKVFRTQGRVSPDSLSLIASAFLVWNYDATSYFSRELARPDV